MDALAPDFVGPAIGREDVAAACDKIAFGVVELPDVLLICTHLREFMTTGNTAKKPRSVLPLPIIHAISVLFRWAVGVEEVIPPVMANCTDAVVATVSIPDDGVDILIRHLDTVTTPFLNEGKVSSDLTVLDTKCLVLYSLRFACIGAANRIRLSKRVFLPALFALLQQTQTRFMRLETSKPSDCSDSDEPRGLCHLLAYCLHTAIAWFDEHTALCAHAAPCYPCVHTKHAQANWISELIYSPEGAMPLLRPLGMRSGQADTALMEGCCAGYICNTCAPTCNDTDATTSSTVGEDLSGLHVQLFGPPQASESPSCIKRGLLDVDAFEVYLEGWGHEKLSDHEQIVSLYFLYVNAFIASITAVGLLSGALKSSRSTLPFSQLEILCLFLTGAMLLSTSKHAQNLYVPPALLRLSPSCTQGRSFPKSIIMAQFDTDTAPWLLRVLDSCQDAAECPRVAVFVYAAALRCVNRLQLRSPGSISISGDRFGSIWTSTSFQTALAHLVTWMSASIRYGSKHSCMDPLTFTVLQCTGEAPELAATQPLEPKWEILFPIRPSTERIDPAEKGRFHTAALFPFHSQVAINRHVSGTILAMCVIIYYAGNENYIELTETQRTVCNAFVQATILVETHGIKADVPTDDATFWARLPRLQQFCCLVEAVGHNYPWFVPQLMLIFGRDDVDGLARKNFQLSMQHVLLRMWQGSDFAQECEPASTEAQIIGFQAAPRCTARYRLAISLLRCMRLSLPVGAPGVLRGAFDQQDAYNSLVYTLFDIVGRTPENVALHPLIFRQCRELLDFAPTYMRCAVANVRGCLPLFHLCEDLLSGHLECAGKAPVMAGIVEPTIVVPLFSRAKRYMTQSATPVTLEGVGIGVCSDLTTHLMQLVPTQSPSPDVGNTSGWKELTLGQVFDLLAAMFTPHTPDVYALSAATLSLEASRVQLSHAQAFIPRADNGSSALQVLTRLLVAPQFAERAVGIVLRLLLTGDIMSDQHAETYRILGFHRPISTASSALDGTVASVKQTQDAQQASTSCLIDTLQATDGWHFVPLVITRGIIDGSKSNPRIPLVDIQSAVVTNVQQMSKVIAMHLFEGLRSCFVQSDAIDGTSRLCSVQRYMDIFHRFIFSSALDRVALRETPVASHVQLLCGKLAAGGIDTEIEYLDIFDHLSYILRFLTELASSSSGCCEVTRLVDLVSEVIRLYSGLVQSLDRAHPFDFPVQAAKTLLSRCFTLMPSEGAREHVASLSCLVFVTTDLALGGKMLGANRLLSRYELSSLNSGTVIESHKLPLRIVYADAFQLLLPFLRYFPVDSLRLILHIVTWLVTPSTTILCSNNAFHNVAALCGPRLDILNELVCLGHVDDELASIKLFEMMAHRISATTARRLLRLLHGEAANAEYRSYCWALLDVLVRVMYNMRTCLSYRAPPLLLSGTNVSAPTWERPPFTLSSQVPMADAHNAVPVYQGPTPRAYFILPGDESGLFVISKCMDDSLLEGLPRWPGALHGGPGNSSVSGAYTFHCWVHLDKDNCHHREEGSQVTLHLPHILSVWDDGGRSVTLALRRPVTSPSVSYSLQLALQHQKHEPDILEVPCSLLPGRWYHLTLVQQRTVQSASSFFGRGLASMGVDFGLSNATSRIELYINGTMVFVDNARRYPNFGVNVEGSPAPHVPPAYHALIKEQGYPPIPEVAWSSGFAKQLIGFKNKISTVPRSVHVTVGAGRDARVDYPKLASHDAASSIRITTALNGLVSGFEVYKIALSAKQVASLWRQGPDSVGCEGEARRSEEQFESAVLSINPLAVADATFNGGFRNLAPNFQVEAVLGGAIIAATSEHSRSAPNSPSPVAGIAAQCFPSTLVGGASGRSSLDASTTRALLGLLESIPASPGIGATGLVAASVAASIEIILDAVRAAVQPLPMALAHLAVMEASAAALQYNIMTLFQDRYNAAYVLAAHLAETVPAQALGFGAVDAAFRWILDDCWVNMATEDLFQGNVAKWLSFSHNALRSRMDAFMGAHHPFAGSEHGDPTAYPDAWGAVQKQIASLVIWNEDIWARTGIHWRTSVYHASSILLCASCVPAFAACLRQRGLRAILQLFLKAMATHKDIPEIAVLQIVYTMLLRLVITQDLDFAVHGGQKPQRETGNASKGSVRAKDLGDVDVLKSALASSNDRLLSSGELATLFLYISAAPVNCALPPPLHLVTIAELADFHLPYSHPVSAQPFGVEHASVIAINVIRDMIQYSDESAVACLSYFALPDFASGCGAASKSAAAFNHISEIVAKAVDTLAHDAPDIVVPETVESDERFASPHRHMPSDTPSTIARTARIRLATNMSLPDVLEAEGPSYEPMTTGATQQSFFTEQEPFVSASSHFNDGLADLECTLRTNAYDLRNYGATELLLRALMCRNPSVRAAALETALVVITRSQQLKFVIGSMFATAPFCLKMPMGWTEVFRCSASPSSPLPLSISLYNDAFGKEFSETTESPRRFVNVASILKQLVHSTLVSLDVDIAGENFDAGANYTTYWIHKLCMLLLQNTSHVGVDYHTSMSTVKTGIFQAPKTSESGVRQHRQLPTSRSSMGASEWNSILHVPSTSKLRAGGVEHRIPEESSSQGDTSSRRSSGVPETDIGMAMELLDVYGASATKFRFAGNSTTVQQAHLADNADRRKRSSINVPVTSEVVDSVSAAVQRLTSQLSTAPPYYSLYSLSNVLSKYKNSSMLEHDDAHSITSATTRYSAAGKPPTGKLKEKVDTVQAVAPQVVYTLFPSVSNLRSLLETLAQLLENDFPAVDTDNTTIARLLLGHMMDVAVLGSCNPTLPPHVYRRSHQSWQFRVEYLPAFLQALCCVSDPSRASMLADLCTALAACPADNDHILGWSAYVYFAVRPQSLVRYATRLFDVSGSPYIAATVALILLAPCLPDDASQSAFQQSPAAFFIHAVYGRYFSTTLSEPSSPANGFGLHLAWNILRLRYSLNGRPAHPRLRASPIDTIMQRLAANISNLAMGKSISSRGRSLSTAEGFSRFTPHFLELFDAITAVVYNQSGRHRPGCTTDEHADAALLDELEYLTCETATEILRRGGSLSKNVLRCVTAYVVSAILAITAAGSFATVVEMDKEYTPLLRLFCSLKPEDFRSSGVVLDVLIAQLALTAYGTAGELPDGLTHCAEAASRVLHGNKSALLDESIRLASCIDNKAPASAVLAAKSYISRVIPELVDGVSTVWQSLLPAISAHCSRRYGAELMSDGKPGQIFSLQAAHATSADAANVPSFEEKYRSEAVKDSVVVICNSDFVRWSASAIGTLAFEQHMREDKKYTKQWRRDTKKAQTTSIALHNFLNRPRAVYADARDPATDSDSSWIVPRSYKSGRRPNESISFQSPASPFLRVREEVSDMKGQRVRFLHAVRSNNSAVGWNAPFLWPHHWRPSLWMLQGSGMSSLEALARYLDSRILDQLRSGNDVRWKDSEVNEDKGAGAAEMAPQLITEELSRLNVLVVAAPAKDPGGTLTAHPPGQSASVMPNIEAVSLEAVPQVESDASDGEDATELPGMSHQGAPKPEHALQSRPNAAAVSGPPTYRCRAVIPMRATPGHFVITHQALYFVRQDDDTFAERYRLTQALQRAQPDPYEHIFAEEPKLAGTEREAYRDKLLPPASSIELPFAQIASMEARRFQFMHVALEFFDDKGCSYMFAFQSKEDRKAVADHVLARSPPSMARFLGRSRASRQAAWELAARWRKRQVSNFDYLTGLNRLAGRTFNDISQYPIFPWILADYASDTLDINNAATFRDLAYPIGAQTPQRREALRSRYAQGLELYEHLRAEEDAYGDVNTSMIFTGPPFHFGSFILNPVTVTWYLMRIEPFTTYHIVFHDGKFDKPDRSFWSIARAFDAATAKESDVKELVPEFFYSADFLRNSNGLVLGHRQEKPESGGYLDGCGLVDDVVLPPWAASPEDFILKHRQALESDIVSRKLHLWVDLVFGHKQLGPHIRGGTECAVAACNVFHHLMYEDGVNLHKLRELDSSVYKRVLTFIDNYGIMPPVMFPFRSSTAPRSELDFSDRSFNKLHEMVHDIRVLTDVEANDPHGCENPINAQREEPNTEKIGNDSPMFSRYHDACSQCCMTVGLPASSIDKDLERSVTRSSHASTSSQRRDSILPWPPVPTVTQDTVRHPPEMSKRLGSSMRLARGTTSSFSSDAKSRKGKSSPLQMQLHREAIICIFHIPGTSLLVTMDQSRDYGIHRWLRTNGTHYLHVDDRSTYGHKLWVALSKLASSKPDEARAWIEVMPAQPADPRTGTAEPLFPAAWRVLPIEQNQMRSETSSKCLVGTEMALTLHEPLLRDFERHHEPIPTAAARYQRSWVRSQLFDIFPDGLHVLSCGHWDRSMRVTNLQTGGCVQTVPLFDGRLTTAVKYMQATPARFTIAAAGLYMHMESRSAGYGRPTPSFIATSPAGYQSDQGARGPLPSAAGERTPGLTGAIDPAWVDAWLKSPHKGGVVAIGDVDGQVTLFDTEGFHVIDGPKFEFAHHTAAVTEIALSQMCDTIATSSLDGTVNVYSLRTKTLRFTLYPMRFSMEDCAQAAITWVGIGGGSVLLMYNAVNMSLHSYSMNGVPLCPPVKLSFDAFAFCWTLDGSMVCIGGNGPFVEVRDAHTLELRHRLGMTGADLSDPDVLGQDPMPFQHPITSLAFSEHEMALFVGLGDGELMAFTIGEAAKVARVLATLENALGF